MGAPAIGAYGGGWANATDLRFDLHYLEGGQAVRYHYFGDEGSAVGILVQMRNLEKITSIDSLKDKIIVAQSGSLHEALAAEKVHEYHEFRRMNTIQEVYLAVANRWADAAVVNVAAAKAYIESHPKQKLALVPGLQLQIAKEMQGDRVAGKKGEVQLMYFVNGVIDQVLANDQYNQWIAYYQDYWDRISGETDKK